MIVIRAGVLYYESNLDFLSSFLVIKAPNTLNSLAKSYENTIPGLIVKRILGTSYNCFLARGAIL